MPSTAYSTLIDSLLLEPGLTSPTVDNRFGYKFSAATVSATSLTTSDPNLLALGANYVSDRFQGWHLYLFTAGESRMVTTMSVSGSTATLNFIGGNATTQASPTNAYLLRAPWTEIRSGASSVLEYIPVRCLVPLAHGPDDHHMQANNTTSWTGANATIAKQTTAAEVLWGARSLSSTLTAGSGYATSTTVRAGQSEGVIGYALAKADTGAAIFRLLDDAGNTLESVSFTQEDWLLLRKQAALEPDDEGVIIRILGTDNLDQIDVQAAWLVFPNLNTFPLPSWLDERFKLQGVSVAYYMQGGRETDTWLARNVTYELLKEQDDYRYINRQGDANPYEIEILNPVYRDRPLFLEIDCPASAPYGVATSFTTDAITTIVPPHLFLAGFKEWIGDTYGFKEAAELGRKEFKARVRNRRVLLPASPPWYGPLGGRRV